MKFYDYFAFFALVTFVLAAVAGVRAKSRASLFAGGLSAILLVVACTMAARREQMEGVNYGYIVGLAVSALLLGRFLPAWLKTKKFYPAGIMALLSLGGIAAGVLGLVMKEDPARIVHHVSAES